MTHLRAVPDSVLALLDDREHARDLAARLEAECAAWKAAASALVVFLAEQGFGAFVTDSAAGQRLLDLIAGEPR